jgi:Methyltransferase domain
MRPTHYKEIPGWFLPEAEEIYLAMVSRAKDGAVFVELGTWLGKSAAFMAEAIKLSGKDIRFYTVDSFKFYDDKTDEWRLANNITWPRGTYTSLDTGRNLAPLKDYVSIVPGRSWFGIPMWDDEMVDFCWVDASHEYQDVRRDLEYWLPRSKIIGGDDYGFEGVRQAVDELAPRAKTGQFWMLDPNPYYEGK